MDHAALFADLPQEIQYDILRYLEADRRLTFIQSSPAVQASVSRNITWLMPLLVAPSARNLALATIHAPQRGEREHIRQFRTRVTAFMAEYNAGAFQHKLPNAYITSDGRPRTHPSPRTLARLRDLIDLLLAIDALVRDHVRKIRMEDRRQGRGADLLASALNTTSSEATDSTINSLGVGTSLQAEAYVHREEAYQGKVHAAFFRLELFRRLFYQDPLQPLFASGDVSPPRSEPKRSGYALSRGDARAHGFATQWDNVRRARVWNGEYIRARAAWRACSRQRSGEEQEPTQTKENLMAQLKGIVAETRSTLDAFQILWTQYALWVDSELHEFRYGVLDAAGDAARAEKLAVLRHEAKCQRAGMTPRRLFAFPQFARRDTSRLTDTDLMIWQEHERRNQACDEHVRLTVDYEFAEHNMALMLPERERLGKFDEPDSVWPEMFRYLTFLTSLGLPFFDRCLRMDQHRRRQMLESIFLYLGRIPAHRIPHFVLGDLDPAHPDTGLDSPLLNARQELYLHPTFPSVPGPLTTLSRLANNLSSVLGWPSWESFDGIILGRQDWEAILGKHATEVIDDRLKLPFKVSVDLWHRMQKPRFETRAKPGNILRCTLQEYVEFGETDPLNTTRSDQLVSAQTGVLVRGDQGRRGDLQLREAQLMMDNLGRN